MKPDLRNRAHAKSAPNEFEVRIEKLVYGGDGLGRAFGKVVFVPFTVPGDLVLVRTLEEKKNFIRAAVQNLIEPGEGRCQPLCPYFGSCGGCQWQQLEYERQVEVKRSILQEILQHRFPETRNLAIPMVASPAHYGYRSRARVQVRGSGPDLRVGFFKFRSHDVEDIQMCPQFRPALNEALGQVRARARAPNPQPPAGEVELACSEEEGTWATAETGAVEAGTVTTEGGVLRRQIGGVTYLTSPAAFFQPNDFVTTDLVASVATLARGARQRTALDLFSGAGLFSLQLAREFESVTAVEASGTACDLCSRNAAEAGLANVRVVCADVNRWLSAVGSVSAPGFDLVLLDPPRTGAGTGVMSRLAEWAPETLIYVSCDPQTLARDLAALPERDYRIEAAAGFDMFPQTYHFETIVKAVRR